MRERTWILSIMLLMILLIPGCFDNGPTSHPVVDREDRIPADAVKQRPGDDRSPPVLHSSLFKEPIPLGSSINTAGAEDSPFILPDGRTLYFFFTPDVDVPPEKQVIDEVSGIYVSNRMSGNWSEPERVWLQDPGKLALDGAPMVDGNTMWFASTREGYTGVNMFTAERVNGEWKNRKYAGDLLNVDYEIGEVHVVGNRLYFHSGRSGGKGGYDIWTTDRVNGTWSEPVNLEAVNSPESDSLPWVNPTETELWFTRTYFGTPGIFRSLKMNGTWSQPELMISQFAGEPSLDSMGNLYFVHHFYRDGKMLEADIYLAERI